MLLNGVSVHVEDIYMSINATYQVEMAQQLVPNKIAKLDRAREVLSALEATVCIICYYILLYFYYIFITCNS